MSVPQLTSYSIGQWRKKAQALGISALGSKTEVYMRILLHLRRPAPRESSYAPLCRQFVPDCDPRHVEAFLRLEYGTLDHLGRATFRRQCMIAKACIAEGGTERAEKLAKSYGL